MRRARWSSDAPTPRSPSRRRRLGDFGAYFLFVERDGDPTLFERRP
jgi:hypothetical protein